MKIVLAGYGHQGKTYAAKIAANAKAWGVDLAAIVDTSAATLSQAAHDYEGAGLYQEIDHALVEVKPDIVINTANNEAHIEIIRALERHPSVRGYLTEKPLVGNPADEEEAVQRLRNYFVSMNMITNFSQAAEEMRDVYQNNPEWKLIGIDTVWGKDRRNDTRPTTGIANDIVHPVGLIQSIFKPIAWSIYGPAQGLYGDLSQDRDGNTLSCVFQYRAKFNTDIAPVVMDCSYAWGSQHRRVTAFLQKEDRYLAAELFLDEPEQGSTHRSDFLRLSGFDKSFKPAVLDEGSRSTRDKLETYLRKSFKAFKEGLSPTEAGLVGLPEEKQIGKVFGILHPSTDWKDLYNDPNLYITDASPNSPMVPKHPSIKTVAESDSAALQFRLSHFGPHYRAEAPIATFTERLVEQTITLDHP